MKNMLFNSRQYDLARRLNLIANWQQDMNYNQPPSALDYNLNITNDPTTSELLVFDGSGDARTQILGG